MSPWNYPFQLTVTPLVGAIAAGNTAIVKPSAYSPATSHLLAHLLKTIFPPEYVTVIEGGREANKDLLAQHFDYIFFTGSPAVGKFVMESASRFLTPVTLELGGKSPCIIDKTADISLAARRAVWGKCINAGQTCIAPDYFLVHESVKDQFIIAARKYIRQFYGDDPVSNPEYPRIINQRHFDRLSALILNAESVNSQAHLISEKHMNSETLSIEPVIIDNIDWDDPIMAEELFGPIIPIIGWTDEADITEHILARPRPLALYLFTRDREQEKRMLSRIPFGGGCINDTVMHVATNGVPFGGTGGSGMGRYHGKDSFTTFSREKTVISKSLLIDVPLRYPPFAGKYKKYRKLF